jgi:hypothetical protein
MVTGLARRRNGVACDLFAGRRARNGTLPQILDRSSNKWFCLKLRLSLSCSLLVRTHTSLNAYLLCQLLLAGSAQVSYDYHHALQHTLWTEPLGKPNEY